MVRIALEVIGGALFHFATHAAVRKGLQRTASLCAGGFLARILAWLES